MKKRELQTKYCLVCVVCADMEKKRETYSIDFKIQTVRALGRNGSDLIKTSKEIRVNIATLRGWARTGLQGLVKLKERDLPMEEISNLANGEEFEFRLLIQENQHLKRENELLRKFAKM
ncbi:hypothetical protein [Pelagibaculum spongiae]|uniref:Transposase n=1 Tax=Pelagibaculum spongiae TaxID=2080658 RepID=A0A2V1GYB4_9GAMM|nr:hypothetical protein [Pelagibaculum spongiae]PVZ66753.1 hypothetical protein DC094_15925 [Pelagibaculum spongiae]